MHLSEEFLSLLPEKIKIRETKHFHVFTDDNKNKAYFSGKKLQMLKYFKGFGECFLEITEEEAKKRHLGKVRCIGSVSCEKKIYEVFSKYFDFSFDIEKSKKLDLKQVNVDKIKKQKARKKTSKDVNKLPKNRDEKLLVNRFRKTDSKKEKDKIFKTILYQRGVNGKTWDEIIKSYVFNNRIMFAHLKDRNENDFYQEIVIGLYNQINTWFDTSKNVCFSTYAWYVIKSSFLRVLQSLSTKKRKNLTYQNVELDNDEYCWYETISIENAETTSFSIEDGLNYKDLYNYVETLIEQKTINAPENLKCDILKIIENSSDKKLTLFDIAVKYDMSVETIFSIERDLKKNIRNSMYNDILTHMKYNINCDDIIANKYGKSKGHVIKTKKDLACLIHKALERDKILV